VDSIYDITWVVDPDGRPVKYGEIRLQDELQFSVYNFEWADVEKAWKHFELYESECKDLLGKIRANLTTLLNQGGAISPEVLQVVEEKGEEYAILALRAPLLAAYDLCLKCSHLFNILDARGAISVTERVGVIARVRGLAVEVARIYVEQQQVDATRKQKAASKQAEQLAASRS
jgi:glycyl-tRNA synthetase alpha chain